MNRLVQISTVLPLTPEERDILETILSDALEELGRGDDKYGHHPGPKRAFGALRAEVTELQTELEAENVIPGAIRKEAVQVAAMAIKFLRDTT